MDHQISDRRSDLEIVNKKENLSYRVKLKESEKRGKYEDLAREQKIWNMKVTVIAVVVGVLGTIPKGLVKGLENFEIRGKVETITVYREEFWRLEETCSHSNSSEIPSANA